jgi:TIR domain
VTKIILSYRRQDSAAITGRIFDRLAKKFGSRSIFMDVDNIPIGIDFRKRFNEELDTCNVLVVIIGKGWVGERPSERPRIEDEEDFVRMEVEIALARDIPIIPVLVDGGIMPKPNDIPPSLSSLTYNNAAEVGSGRDFHANVDRLIEAIRAILVRSTETPRQRWISFGKSMGLALLLVYANLALGAAAMALLWPYFVLVIFFGSLLLAAVLGYRQMILSGPVMVGLTAYAALIALLAFELLDLRDIPVWKAIASGTLTSLFCFVEGALIGHGVRWVVRAIRGAIFH